MKKVGTKRATSRRRLVLAVVAMGFVVVGVAPQASYAAVTSAGDGVVAQVDEGPPKCGEGEELKDGVCVPIGCEAPQVPNRDTGKCEDPPCADGEIRNDAGVCQKPEPEPCADGTIPAPGAECPAPPVTTPCPDGQPFCSTVRSCPTDTPLPQGSTCETPVPTTTPAPPVPPAASPTGDRGTFGRPAVVEGAGADRPTPTPAPVPDSLARTGINEWLAVIGTVLVLIGMALVRWATPPGVAMHA